MKISKASFTSIFVWQKYSIEPTMFNDIKLLIIKQSAGETYFRISILSYVNFRRKVFTLRGEKPHRLLM